MTGFVLKPFRDRVEILSDGASYTSDGVIVDIRHKVKTSDVVPLAVVGSGDVGVIDCISDMILIAAKVAASVDGVLEIIALSLSVIAAKVSAGDGPARVAIAAISETRGTMTLLFDTFGPDAFVLQEKPFGFGQGEYPPHEEMLAAGWSPSASLDEYGTAVFEFMRSRKRPNPAYPDEEPIYSIGGHLDFTVVRPEGYQQRRLLTWPDVVGQPINPLG